MNRATLILMFVAAVLSFGGDTIAEEGDRLELIHADRQVFQFSKVQDTTFVRGAVVFATSTGMIYCDSATWMKGEAAILWGSVIIDDEAYHLAADSVVHYNLVTGRAVALGDYVELWSYADSLLAIGKQAFFDRDRQYFYMQDRPTVFLNYPDSLRMIEVIADFIEYEASRGSAEAEGSVRLNSTQFWSTSGCAVMNLKDHSLDLSDSPVLKRDRSEISGSFVSVISDGDLIRQVEVIDSAHAEFVHPAKLNDSLFDRSILSGDRIIMDFTGGALETVTCTGQAYSWYVPASEPGATKVENEVSGDTVAFSVENEELVVVKVIGGAIGSYLTTTERIEDSTTVVTVDTINYQGHEINYLLRDSLIILDRGASTQAGAVSLSAHQIKFDTKLRIIEAYSGQIGTDSITDENLFSEQLQPNEIPVRLMDRQQSLVGDYLRYSIDTEKGRIVTSKSAYETGYFYGEKLHRQQENIFYLENGRYTTCDADEPHFHFTSSNLKLIQDNKLIARPVVLSIGRLPILALPYYVFPLKKGRHSGILPFKLGNIERGERYIENVGYFWAASEYWDWQGDIDYYEDRDRLNIFNRFSYKKRYVFDGMVSGNWGRESNFDEVSLTERKQTRWTATARHNHDFSPSFHVSAYGHILSDASYYNDFSTDMSKRLNRLIRSYVNFSKRFSRSVSVSGKISHDDDLDRKARSDQLPSLGISLPTVRPFGSGQLDEDGILRRRWYNEAIATYRPKLFNFSSRQTIIDRIDTVTDASGLFVSADSVTHRTRKKYTRMDHSLAVSFPITLAKYLIFNPSATYAENWFKIYRTDQSDAVGIDASTTYRAYKYDLGAKFSTKLYGTVHPNILGLIGLRQVISPSVSYRQSPKIDRHPEVSTYAGGSARSLSKSQSMTFSLNHTYQAKVSRGQAEKILELMSITSHFSYNFEAELRKLSNLSTTFNSSLLRNIRMNATTSHSFYPSLEEGGDESDFWHPRLLTFRLNSTLNLAGRQFLFDGLDQAVGDSTEAAPRPSGIPRKQGGWNLTTSYSYSERNVGTTAWVKTSNVNLRLNFNLTPTTTVAYSQYYNFVRDKSVSSEVTFFKTIHCWTGRFHWVPTGSTKGWGFELFVTALPEVRIDRSSSRINSGMFQ